MRKLVLVLAMLAALRRSCGRVGARRQAARRPVARRLSAHDPAAGRLRAGGLRDLARQQFYVGSVQNGAIYTGDLRTGPGALLVPGAIDRGHGRRDRARVRPRPAVGRGRRLGTAKLYQAKTGALLHTYQLGTPPATFLNDIVGDEQGRYLTDSQQPVIYRVSRSQARGAAVRSRRSR